MHRGHCDFDDHTELKWLYYELERTPLNRRTARLVAAGDSIVERFERVCAVYPHQPAIVSDSPNCRPLDYQSLNIAANAVAMQLIERIEGSQQRIALLFAEAQSALVAMLGILKAGHTYVPLDPDYPHERPATCSRTVVRHCC